MSSVSVETMQRLVDGPWKHAAGAREACRQGEWLAFQDRITSESRPGWTKLRERKAYKACLARAAELFVGPRDVELRLYPMWSGNSEDGEPRIDCWFATHGLIVGDGELNQLEVGPVRKDADSVLRSVVVCAARIWDVGSVVKTRSYAPSIELELRKGAWGVLRGDVVEVAAVTDVIDLEPNPRPDIEVPSWCCWTEPRVKGLPQPIVDTIRSLSITTDDEGNLIDRPADDPADD